MKRFTLLLLCMGLLTVLQAQSESEPNNNCATSNLIQVDQWVSARMADTLGSSDRDYFQLEIIEPGQYLIEINTDSVHMAPNLVLSTFNDCDDNTVSVRLLSDPNFSNPVFYALVIHPGILHFYFRKNKSVIFNHNYNFRISNIKLDTFESDNSFDKAKTIKFGDTILANANGIVFGQEIKYGPIDEDWYKIQISQKGILFPRLISIPATLIPEVLIYNSDMQLVGKNCCNLIGKPMECLQQLLCEPGDFYIKVKFSDTIINNSIIPSPYQMIVDFIPDSTECNQTLNSATPLELGNIYNAYIGGRCGTKRDIDIYKIQSDKPGNLIIDIWDPDSTSAKYIYFLDKDSTVIFSGYYYAHYYISFSRPRENAHLYFLYSSDPYYIVIEERASDNCQNPRLFSPYQIMVNVNTEDTTECNNLVHETKLVICQTEVSAVLDPTYDIDRFWVKIPKGDSISLSFVYNEPNVNLDVILTDRITGKEWASWRVTNSDHFGYFNPYNLEDFVISITRRSPDYEDPALPYKFMFHCTQNSTGNSDVFREDFELIALSNNQYILQISDFKNLSNLQSPFIYNILGHKIMLPIEKIEDGWTLDANHLSTGIYFLHCNLNGNTFIKKFLR